MAVKVCLDAGHYGKYNRSPAVSSYYESDMTWKLHNYLKKELEAFGIVVVSTRTNQNTDRALYERGAASKGCNLFISVHSNATGNGVNESVDYPVAYVLLNGSSTDIGLKLAKVVESVMGTAQSGRTATRQGTNGEYYGVLRGANAVGTPGIILEHSFHTNTRATKWLSSDSNLQKLAKAEAECIASYYGITKKEENTFTKIMGNAVATVEQMTAYIKAKNPDVAQSVIDMIPLYLSEGKAEGVSGDIAFAQSCLETGNFGFSGSAVTLDQNNFCGMGVTKNGETGNSFSTPQLGIRAQVQHLKAYANTTKLKQDCIDPRFDLVSRGCAPYVEYLGIQENPKGKGWAAGAGYGGKILKILDAIKGAGSGQAGSGGQDSGKKPDDEDKQQAGFTPYLITTTCDVLNIRSGAGTGHSVVGAIREKAGKKNKYTIVEEKDGWGRLKSGAGWISLSYTKKAS